MYIDIDPSELGQLGKHELAAFLDEQDLDDIIEYVEEHGKEAIPKDYTSLSNEELANHIFDICKAYRSNTYTKKDLRDSVEELLSYLIITEG